MWSRGKLNPLFLVVVLVAMLGLLAAACGGDDSDVTQEDLDAANASLASSKTQVSQLRAQIAATGPVTVVQAGQLAPAGGA